MCVTTIVYVAFRIGINQGYIKQTSVMINTSAVSPNLMLLMVDEYIYIVQIESRGGYYILTSDGATNTTLVSTIDECKQRIHADYITYTANNALKFQRVLQ